VAAGVDSLSDGLYRLVAVDGDVTIAVGGKLTTQQASAEEIVLYHQDVHDCRRSRGLGITD